MTNTQTAALPELPAPSRAQINDWMREHGWQNSAIRQADLHRVERVVRAALAAARTAETDIRLEDDDALRFACRVLDGEAPLYEDSMRAKEGLYAIRTRMRTYAVAALAASRQAQPVQEGVVPVDLAKEREFCDREFNASKYMQVVHAPQHFQAYWDGWQAAINVRGATDWRARTIEAETTLRHMSRALAEATNGPTHMGEPVIAAQQPAVPEGMVMVPRDVLQRCVSGIDHLAELARQWEPDHSSGADRRGWVLAKDARDDAQRVLAASPQAGQEGGA